MVIGFTQRHQTVSECDIPGEDLCLIEIELSAERISEIEHYYQVFHQISISTAVVEPLIFDNTVDFDATFGSRNYPGDRIENHGVFEPLSDLIPPQRVFIKNDIRPESNESFTISIFSLVFHLDFFSCNNDYDEGATNYFCQHTITIIDNDGTKIKASF